MIVAFLIFCVFFIVSIIKIIEKRLDIQDIILNLLWISMVSVFILMYPLITQYKFLDKVLNVLFYTFESNVMNQDTSIIEPLLTQGIFPHIYYMILQILFIVMPALAVGVVISRVTNVISFVKIKYALKMDEIHIFSEINEKSEFFAQRLIDKVDDDFENSEEIEKLNIRKSIIFSNKDNKSTKIKLCKANEDITDISINNQHKKLAFYALSLDEDKNISDGLNLIQKYKENENVTIYVLCNDKNASLIFDSVDKGKLTFELVNEVERSIYNLLDTHPLYLESINKTISVLVIGCGNTGLEFLRDATWCSIMPEYQYRATVIDIHANKIKEQIDVEAPEFLNNYSIHFIEADYKSYQAIDFIKKNKDVNYIFISMDTDKKNLDAAIMFRERYLKIHDRLPSIHIWCSDEEKMEQINQMKTQRNQYYQIHAFGSNQDNYYENKIIHSKFERIAMDVHSAYKDDTLTDEEKRKNYNDREYFKQSSRASALHIKYKLYVALGDKFTSDMHENQILFAKIYKNNKELKKVLMDCEHDRWNAYVRSIGYTYISVPEVGKYYKEINHHENALTKQHPAIVSNEELDKVSNELKQYKENINLKEYDEKIVDGLVNGKIRL